MQPVTTVGTWPFGLDYTLEYITGDNGHTLQHSTMLYMTPQ